MPPHVSGVFVIPPLFIVSLFINPLELVIVLVLWILEVAVTSPFVLILTFAVFKVITRRAASDADFVD